jgi:hypothetical protein
VLAENPTGLLGKAFVTRDRRLFGGFGQLIRGFCCFLDARIALAVFLSSLT